MTNDELVNIYRRFRADLATGVAAGTLGQVDGMPVVGSHRDGSHRAVLRTERATDAALVNGVGYQVLAFAGRAMPLQVGLVLRAVIAERGQDRVGCRLAQAANAARTDHAAKHFQFFEIALLPLAGGDAVEYVEHAAVCRCDSRYTCRTTDPG